MTELRSITGSNSWHIIHNDKSLCGLAHNATLSITIPDGELPIHIISYTTEPGFICGRCLLYQREHKPKLYSKTQREHKPKLYFKTFRVLPEDVQLLREIFGRHGKQSTTPDPIAEILTSINTDNLQLPAKKEKRRSICVGIPDILQAAIDERCQTTQESFIKVLMAAVREFTTRHSTIPMEP